MEVKVLELQTLPPLGNEAAAVKTTLKYRVTVVAPSRTGIHKYLNSQLDGHLPPNFAAANGSVKMVSAQVLAADSGIIRLHLVGTANLRGILSAAKIRALIKGKSIGEAKQLLTKQNEVADFKMEFKDPHLLTIPRFDFQIKLLFPAGTNAR